MTKEIDEAIEKLAQIVKVGFDEVYKRFDTRFDAIDYRFGRMEKQLQDLENGQKSILAKMGDFAYRYEVEGLSRRVDKLELNLSQVED